MKELEPQIQIHLNVDAEYTIQGNLYILDEWRLYEAYEGFWGEKKNCFHGFRRYGNWRIKNTSMTMEPALLSFINTFHFLHPYNNNFSVRDKGWDGKYSY